MPARPDRRLFLAGLSAALVPLKRAAAASDPAAPRLMLTAAPAPAPLLVGDGKQAAELWGFEGLGPAPILRVRHGEPFRATVRNRTAKPLSLHWHGVRGPAASDGVGGFSNPPVPPGGTFDVEFTPPDSGTFLVRPLLIGGSSEPGGRGLSALLVVEERQPPAIDAEFTLLVRDWRVEAGGALAPFGRAEDAALAGRLGNVVTAGDGAAPKRITLPGGSRIRLRIVNGSNARATRIRFDGLKAYVGAVDGQPTDIFEPLRSTLPFAPGARYDLFLDVPRETGATGTLVALIGPGIPLVEVAASAAPPVERSAVPAALPPNTLLPPEIRLQNALRKDLTLSGGAVRSASGELSFPDDPTRAWKINGAAGAAGNPPLFSARRGQPVVLGIINATGFAQTLHLHGHVFRLLHPLDDGWEPYWLDSLQVPEGKTVHVAFLADNPGRWLLSSTVLERFDTGMWTWFEVV